MGALNQEVPKDSNGCSTTKRDLVLIKMAKHSPNHLTKVLFPSIDIQSGLLLDASHLVHSVVSEKHIGLFVDVSLPSVRFSGGHHQTVFRWKLYVLKRTLGTEPVGDKHKELYQ